MTTKKHNARCKGRIDVLNKIIEDLEKNPEIAKLPPGMRSAIKSQIESLNKVEFPVVTFKEDDWVVAQTPLIDVCAQGRTEEEAIKNLKAMIDDWMTDPDTPKPKIETILKMEIGIKTVHMKMPIVPDCHEPLKHTT